MPVEKLIVSTFAGNGMLLLFLDSKLVMENTGAITIDLPGNETYVVHWFVQGYPGSSYSITISSPKEATFQLTRGVPRSGKDFGGIQFKT